MSYREIWSSNYASIQQERTSPPGKNESERFSKVYSYYLRGWLPEKKEMRMLDAGCGAGLLLNTFKKSGFTHAMGIDSSPSQTQIASQSGFEVVTGNALEFLKEKQNAFGLISALDLIEHLTRDESLEFLDTCFQSLEPGGRLILQTPNGESPWVGSVFHGDLTHEQCFTPHLLEKCLRHSGFENIQYRPCGPAPVDFLSIARKLTWEGMTLVCRLLNQIEGAVSSGVYTRVFLISATRPR